jgi:hypothetical protein
MKTRIFFPVPDFTRFSARPTLQTGGTFAWNPDHFGLPGCAPCLHLSQSDWGRWQARSA